MAASGVRNSWLASAMNCRSRISLSCRASRAPPTLSSIWFSADRRFRPNADPYRTDTGITVAGPGGTPYAAVLSARSLAVQVGYQAFHPGQLRRYRDSVDGAAGETLEEVLAALRRDDLVPHGVPALTARPRGYAADHPRLALLRLRGLHVDRTWPAGEWLRTEEPLDQVRVAWRAARPLADWLDAHVGPRDEPVFAARRPPA